MLRFVSRTGKPLAESEWQRLLRDPVYTVLERSVVCGRVRVEAAWLGVVCGLECAARPFVVTVEGGGRAETTWHATEAEARDRFDYALLDVLDELAHREEV